VLKDNSVVWSNVKRELPVLNIVNIAMKARSIQNVKHTKDKCGNCAYSTNDRIARDL